MIIGGGPHINTRVESDGGNRCSFNITSLIKPLLYDQSINKNAKKNQLFVNGNVKNQTILPSGVVSSVYQSLNCSECSCANTSSSFLNKISLSDWLAKSNDSFV